MHDLQNTTVFFRYDKNKLDCKEQDESPRSNISFTVKSRLIGFTNIMSK